MRLLFRIIKYIYYKIISNNRTIKGILDCFSIFYNIQKFLIIPEIRFLASIHIRLISLIFKLWYLFHITRGLNLIKYKRKKKKYLINFMLIYLIFTKSSIKIKLKIFNERYKSKCSRFILRQLNYRFAVIRYLYRKYYLLRHFLVKIFPYIITYHYYINFYKYVDFSYGILMLFYIMLLFSLAIFSGFIFTILIYISSDNYFYNLGAWMKI